MATDVDHPTGSSRLLSVENVSKTFPATSYAAEITVLHDVSLQMTASETVAIVGASGSGKSTLLNLIAALDSPTSGQITLNGSDIVSMTEAQLSVLRNRTLGVIFQQHHLLPQCTALENALLPTLAGKSAITGESPEDRAKRLLKRVGLGERMSHFPSQLSGGERQRAALARALIHSPALLLADEPTGALDRSAADNLLQLLAEINREEGVAILMVTHDPAAAARMSRQLKMQDGRLLEA